MMFVSDIKESSRVKWRHLVNDIITTCFRVANVVHPVVSNSSPEGNIPDDVTSMTTDCQGEPCLWSLVIQVNL